MTTVRDRLIHIQEAITAIRTMLAGRSIDEVASDLALKPAFERYLEIISEASRHLPAEMKTRHSAGVPWQKVADLGNILRHAYQRSNLRILWAVYTDDLGGLEAAVLNMIAEADAPTPPAPPNS